MKLKNEWHMISNAEIVDPHYVINRRILCVNQQLLKSGQMTNTQGHDVSQGQYNTVYICITLYVHSDSTNNLY